MEGTAVSSEPTASTSRQSYPHLQLTRLHSSESSVASTESLQQVADDLTSWQLQQVRYYVAMTESYQQSPCIRVLGQTKLMQQFHTWLLEAC